MVKKWQISFSRRSSTFQQDHDRLAKEETHLEYKRGMEATECPSCLMQVTIGQPVHQFISILYKIVIPTDNDFIENKHLEIWVYLPNTAKGRCLLTRFRYAFLKGLMFKGRTLGGQVSSKQSSSLFSNPEALSLASIPLKTSFEGGGLAGFPDPNYLHSANAALNSLNVPTADQCLADCNMNTVMKHAAKILTLEASLEEFKSQLEKSNKEKESLQHQKTILQNENLGLRVENEMLKSNLKRMEQYFERQLKLLGHPNPNTLSSSQEGRSMSIVHWTSQREKFNRWDSASSTSTMCTDDEDDINTGNEYNKEEHDEMDDSHEVMEPEYEEEEEYVDSEEEYQEEGEYEDSDQEYDDNEDEEQQEEYQDSEEEEDRPPSPVYERPRGGKKLDILRMLKHQKEGTTCCSSSCRTTTPIISGAMTAVTSGSDHGIHKPQRRPSQSTEVSSSPVHKPFKLSCDTAQQAQQDSPPVLPQSSERGHFTLFEKYDEEDFVSSDDEESTASDDDLESDNWRSPLHSDNKMKTKTKSNSNKTKPNSGKKKKEAESKQPKVLIGNLDPSLSGGECQWSTDGSTTTAANNQKQSPLSLSSSVACKKSKQNKKQKNKQEKKKTESKKTKNVKKNSSSSNMTIGSNSNSSKPSSQKANKPRSLKTKRKSTKLPSKVHPIS